MNGKAWQQRVIVEAHQLRQKIESLHAFMLTSVFEQLDVRDKDLMRAQQALMRSYLRILDERIERFT